MGLSCFIMANMGTYAEIGITASIGVIMCRILQSFSSLGEIVGAQLYVSEILKRPNKFMASGIIEVSANIGGLVALLIALFSTYFALNWGVLNQVCHANFSTIEKSYFLLIFNPNLSGNMMSS